MSRKGEVQCFSFSLEISIMVSSSCDQNFRVHLVGGVEKWEDRKLWKDIKDFNFPPSCLVGSGKVEKWKK